MEPYRKLQSRILFFLLGNLIFGNAILNAQNQLLIPTGSWRTHLSYHAPKFCQATQKYVYAATDNGLWRTDNFGQMTVLRKTDGFWANEITAMKFNAEKNILVLGYIDG